MKVVGGSASVLLARGIAHELSVGFVDVAFEKHSGGFPDGERYVRLLGPVSGEHVVLVQTTHPDLMIVELFLLADAIRDAGAGVLPRSSRTLDMAARTSAFWREKPS